MHFVGRLATYKYYNMDQVVAQALTLFAKISGVRRADSGACDRGAASRTYLFRSFFIGGFEWSTHVSAAADVSTC